MANLKINLKKASCYKSGTSITMRAEDGKAVDIQELIAGNLPEGIGDLKDFMADIRISINIFEPKTIIKADYDLEREGGCNG